MQAIRELITRHTLAVSALGAAGALLDAHASGQPLDPALDARARELLAALGAPRDLLDDVSAVDAAQLVAELRQLLGVDYRFLFAESRGIGWGFTDPLILQAAGDFSRNFARALTARIIPELDGLSERFAGSGARFLDIGVGVAGIAIELARLWPQLTITGIDVWQPSLQLARANVAAAGLADRITLREQAAQALTDERAFDVVWMPLIFLPERIVPAAMERAFHALEPGGWMVLGFADWEHPDPQLRAFWRLRTTQFGGPPWSMDRVASTLAERGFTEVRKLCTPPNAPVAMAARRPR